MRMFAPPSLVAQTYTNALLLYCYYYPLLLLLLLLSLQMQVSTTPRSISNSSSTSTTDAASCSDVATDVAALLSAVEPAEGSTALHVAVKGRQLQVATALLRCVQCSTL
jgi:hypothetical protein